MFGLRNVSVTTAQLFVAQAMARACGQDCVDWATDMLMQGHDGYNLRMLAGQIAPFYHFEIADLRDRAFNELGIHYPGRDGAAVTLAVEWLRDALAHDGDLGDVARELRVLCYTLDYPSALYPFYLLSFAHEDLQSASFSYHWEQATRENIQSLIREHAHALIASVVAG